MFETAIQMLVMRAGFAAMAIIAGGVISAPAASAAEISIRIERVQALDKIDSGLAGQADFYARVTIACEQFTSQIARGKDDVSPNWLFTKRVTRGMHDVKIQIFDRDPLKADTTVDINRVDNKRDLDFTVDTRTCVVSGFSDNQKCGRTISRSGKERKRAQIWFRVSAR